MLYICIPKYKLLSPPWGFHTTYFGLVHSLPFPQPFPDSPQPLTPVHLHSLSLNFFSLILQKIWCIWLTLIPVSLTLWCPSAHLSTHSSQMFRDKVWSWEFPQGVCLSRFLHPPPPFAATAYLSGRSLPHAIKLSVPFTLGFVLSTVVVSYR